MPELLSLSLIQEETLPNLTRYPYFMTIGHVWTGKWTGKSRALPHLRLSSLFTMAVWHNTHITANTVPV